MRKIDKLLRTFLGLMMIIAVFGKGIGLEEFEIEMKTLLIPFISLFIEKTSEGQAIIKAVEPFLLSVAILILLIESVIGLFLVFKVQVKVAALGLMLLLTTFTSVLVVNLLNPSSELNVCGRFGALWEEPVTWWSVVRNGFLAGLSWVVYRGESGRGGISQPKPKWSPEIENSWKKEEKKVR